MTIEKLLISADTIIKDAMRQMGISSEKILFVTDNRRRLLGTVTDGDIRRWILRKGSLQESVKEIYNSKPEYVYDDYDIEKVKELMVNRKIESVPAVDKNRIIIDVLFWEDVFGKRYKKDRIKLDVPVVIMAGGKGQRMDPFTRILPKPLIPVGEKPAVEIIMDYFYQNGCDEFCLILGYKGEMIKWYFENANLKYKVRYIREGSSLGTAGGLYALKDSLSRPFFLSNCDIIIKSNYREIYEFHINNKNDVTIVASMKHFALPYGVIELQRQSLKRIIEKPEYDFLVNTGMYVLNPKAIRLIPGDKVFHMTDLVKKVKEKKGKVGIFPINERFWLDIGEWEEYKEALKKFEF